MLSLKKALIARNHKPWGKKIHVCAMPCILTTIYILTFQKPSTMYRPRCSEMLSGLCSAFGTWWVVQCHPSIESNPRISTTEHVHALYVLSHIGCTVTINRVKKSRKDVTPLAESDLEIIKKSIERSTLQKVREFFRRQKFGIYWPDNSHLSIIIKYAKVVILSVV